jgi:hypothetical protein
LELADDAAEVRHKRPLFERRRHLFRQ